MVRRPAASYTNGEVGQAFYLNGTNAYVEVPASGSLNVGTNNGLTVEGWIDPAVVDSAPRPIVEWNNHSHGGVWGVHLWDSQSASAYGTGPGCLYLNIQDANNNPPGGYHTLASPAGIVHANVYQHVAFTYDRTSGVATIYLNGVNVAQTTFATGIVPQTSYDFYLGVRASDVPPTLWAGSLDEFSVYNRVLSSNEIGAIYLAGGGGKCFTPMAPVITNQPADSTVVVGQTATFTVSANGTPPLSYHWTFNTTNISGATNSLLILDDVQLNQAGTYAVMVSNLAGSVLSSNAILTVVLPPTNCDPAPSGLVSWWPGEGNANDLIGTNNGVPAGGLSYTNGEVGQAFYLNGTNAYVEVPASGSLNVGTNNGLTVEGWIDPAVVDSAPRPIVEWNNHSHGGVWGVHLWDSQPSSAFGTGPGCLYLNIQDANNNPPGGYHTLASPAGIVHANVYQHVAFTYDQTSGVATIYLNGVNVAQTTFATGIVPQTSYDFYLGVRASDVPPTLWAGSLDEFSVYNRLLSSNEIAAIYLAGSGGKCPPGQPPVITMQPTNQTVIGGQTAAFSVSASGTPPLSYHWAFNTTNIAGATNASLILANVQLTNAGFYSVLVTNRYGSTLSSNAMLTVVLSPTNCDPAPSGLVSWWPGEGNANDLIGTNNGVPAGGLSYSNGEVGQAFYLNGTNAYVGVPASSGLNVGVGNGMTVEGWIDPSVVDSAPRPIVEWNNHSHGGVWGVHLWDSYGTGPGCLYLNIQDANNNPPNGYHTLASPAGVVHANVYQHVAFTYDRTSGVATIYLNGVNVAQTTFPTNIVPQTSYDFYLGVRASDVPPTLWAGSLDEFSVYNRVLSSNEMAAIYLAGSGGKCPPGQLPVITMQPTNQTVVVGQTATFTVSANGTPPLSYQWMFNTTNITGATNAALILANAQLTNAGSYSVLVTNAYGSITSSNALLTVLAPVMITAQPTNLTIYVGGTASFAVTASGTMPLRYQWNFNQTNIANATNATLVLTNVQLSQAGQYAVLVSNLVNSVLSSNAVLTVHLPPTLGATPSGNNLYIFWPQSSPGFVLETTPSLSPADWVIVSNPPIQIGGIYLESVQMTETNRFYRLLLSQ